MYSLEALLAAIFTIALSIATYTIMPSILTSTPFRSLRPDHSCGREHKPQSQANGNGYKSLQDGEVNGQVNAHANGHSNGHANGLSNGHANGYGKADSHDDQFLRLDEPQQDILLLHGPRQKYSLAKAQDIPTLRDDREILVQVLAIGLNPVDWKGADYDFGQPEYPWVNGRDFAGIVVRAPREKHSSRIRQGDIVFGPSTDYRDVRKAAYQEYLVTTDYNVARVPQNVEVKEGAAIGVAYVAAALALGVSIGLDFTRFSKAPLDTDLLRVVRSLDSSAVSKDIHNELFHGIPENERPQSGEWLAIWGGE